ncbi:hypothetical protein MJD09_25290 [bacterium]|nr:hypothetical protein [bacterium]
MKRQRTEIGKHNRHPEKRVFKASEAGTSDRWHKARPPKFCDLDPAVLDVIAQMADDAVREIADSSLLGFASTPAVRPRSRSSARTKFT